MKTLKYRLWLFGCWLDEMLLPVARNMSSGARQLLGTGLVLVAVIVPVNYYLASSPVVVDAVAAGDTMFEQAMSAIGKVNSASAQAEEPVATLAMLTDEAGHSADDGHEHDAGAVEVAPVETAPVETAMDHAKKHMDPTYICPMHPEIVSKDSEATCPICGMDLVPMEATGDAGTVELSPTVINALGVRTNKVKRRNIYRKIDAVGHIDVNEESIRTMALRTEGWIEKLTVKSVGEAVKKGDLLFEVYSPNLVNAQEEFVQALELDSGDGMLIKASEERLRALGVSDEQIETIRDSKMITQHIRYYAPQDGVVSEMNVREGMFVPPSKTIISLVDLSHVWLMVDVFESQVDWVKEGQTAEAQLPFMPDKIWEGEVDYIYPSLDPKTRSLKVRLRFENPDEILKPNMFADVTIFARPKRKVLTVPKEAVIRVGNQARVIVAQGEGKFKPATIHPGVETDSLVEVVGGLDEGQEVVVSSQFLIDSESSMRAALMRMAGG